jgi:CheY-like chemotaxis protein
MESARKAILAVDDIIPSLKATGKILENVFDVYLAKSAKMASRALKANRVDLILLDIEMPEVSGFEYMEQLQQTPQYRDIPVIFVSSHATREFFTQAINSGAKDFIVKPVSPDVLIGKIRAVLGGPPSETVSMEIMKQMLADLKKTCKKGMEKKAGALIKELRDKQFNPAVDACIGKICGLIARAEYETAAEMIKALLKSGFFEKYTENGAPVLTLWADAGKSVTMYL